MVYFYEKQGNPLNGFKVIQFDEVSLDSPLDATNDKVGDSPDAIFYKKAVKPSMSCIVRLAKRSLMS